MAKDRKKLQHIHSSIPDKQPTPASLEVGEIAVNNAKEQEFLSIKNSNDKVVRFSSDGQIISWIERKEVMPYKGYVRGDGGPTATSGDTPASDEKGSYGISNDDLLNNKSELVFKLNQVAADLTTKHDKVNGAKDMYNKEINPTDDYGVNDGAGFFIDMSRYAMRDGNPSFSALTATCQTTLSGNTFIRDGASANTYGTDTGHTLDIKVTDTVVSGETWHETLTAKREDISGRTTTIGNNGENLHVIGTTTEVHDKNVTITNKSNVTENTSGTTTINNVKKTTVNVANDGTEINSCDGISANTNVFIVKQCTEGEGKAQFDFCDEFAVNSDDVKITECTPDGSIVITEKIVEVNAKNTTINDSGNTVINTTVNLSANTTGNVVTNTTGTTTETKGRNVFETNLSDKTENTSGSSYNNVKANYSGTTGGTTTEIKVGPVSETNQSSTTIDRVGAVSINNQSDVTAVTSGNSDVTISGTSKVKVSGSTTADTGGNVTVTTSGKTTETKGGIVTEKNLSAKTENTTGNHSLYVTGNTCVTSQKNANFYGKLNTNIGLACDGTTKASATTVVGTSTLDMSGTTTTLSANSTTITSCGDVTINTNELKVKQCSNAGSAEFDFCDGFKVKSDDVEITQCGSNGSITITEATVEVNAGNTTINDSGNTTVNTTGDTTFITSGSTTIKTEDGTTIQTTAGNTNINTSGNTNITSTGNTCAVADQTGAFKGTVKTNIGKDCSDGGQTATLNINGDTINETGNTVNISAATNVNVSASTICESASTAADFYGSTTNIGVSCGNSTATTVNVSGATINEGGTTNNNNFTTINNTATTINNNTTTYNITGTTNIDGDTIIDGTLNVSGVTTIGDTLIIKKGLEKTLSWEYGSVCDEPTSATSTNFKEDAKFIIPKTLSDVSCEHVTLDTCLNVDTDICVAGKVSARDGFFQTSDRNAKKNIEKPNYEKFAGANSTPIVKFNYKDDETNRDVYGVIAQEAEANGLDEVVYTDENGKKSVDYTSLMILKIGYLENANAILRQQLGELYERVKNLEANK